MGFMVLVWSAGNECFPINVEQDSIMAVALKGLIQSNPSGAAIGFNVATWLLFMASDAGVKEGGPLPLPFNHPFTQAVGTIANVWVEPKPGAAAVPVAAGAGGGSAAAAGGAGGAAAAAGGAGGATSPRERFTALLGGSGMQIDPRVMAVIMTSEGLAMRAGMARTVEEAASVYMDASRKPRTETCAVARMQGVIIDGDMLVDGPQTSSFFHAFKDNKPCVFKVPAQPAGSQRECALWLDVHEAAQAEADVFLVPVEHLQLQGRRIHHLGEGESDVMLLREGIIMPAYHGTLQRRPAPLDADYAIVIINRMEPTLRFLHGRGWLHGDVKPSNIFLDGDGGTWLGDYGSSVRTMRVHDFTGGTPAFQCEDVHAASPLKFDLTGLAISVLVLLGQLTIQSAAIAWPRDAVTVALARVEHRDLQQRLTALLS